MNALIEQLHIAELLADLDALVGEEGELDETPPVALLEARQRPRRLQTPVTPSDVRICTKHDTAKVEHRNGYGRTAWRCPECDQGRERRRDYSADHSPLGHRRDALPEFITYSDSGCDYAPACLGCPLPQCRYDDPRQARQVESADGLISTIERQQRLINLVADGMTIRAAAAAVMMSPRNAARVVAAHRGVTVIRGGKA